MGFLERLEAIILIELSYCSNAFSYKFHFFELQTTTGYS